MGCQGKALVTLGPQSGYVLEFLQAGVPMAFINPEEGVYQTSGNQTIALIKNRPHPNATRLFVNWYLTREGMSIVARTGIRQTCRLDIPEEIIKELPDEKKRQPGIKYFSVETEEYLRVGEDRGGKLCQEIFDPLLK